MDLKLDDPAEAVTAKDNSQLIEAIKQGMAEAVKRAMPERDDRNDWLSQLEPGARYEYDPKRHALVEVEE